MSFKKIVRTKKASDEASLSSPSTSDRVESKLNVLFVCNEWNSSKEVYLLLTENLLLILLKHRGTTLRFSAMFVRAVNQTEKMLENLV